MATGSFSGFGGGSLGMGIAFILHDYFSGPAAGIRNSMSGLRGYTDSFAYSVRSAFLSLQTGVITAFAMMGPIIKSVKVDAEFEKYRATLQTFVGTADEASSVFKRVRDEALNTPGFGVSEIMRANMALISQGVSVDKSMEVTRNLMNELAAAGRGNEELMRMAINLQQIAANNRATNIDIKQFGYAGINVMKLLQEATGRADLSIQGVNKTMKSAHVTFDDIADALKYAATGPHAGALDRVAKSVAGQIERVKEQITMTFADIGEAIRPYTLKVLQVVGDFLQKISDFVATDRGKQVARVVAVVMALIGAMTMLGIVFSAFRLIGVAVVNFMGVATARLILLRWNTVGLSGVVRVLAGRLVAILGHFLVFAARMAFVVAVFYGSVQAINSTNQSLQAFGTLVLMMFGPIGRVVALITWLRRGFSELSSDNPVATGILGFFTKLAAFIAGSIEVFQSWDGEIFRLSETLAVKLEKLGILQYMVNLGTLIGRTIEFVKGFLGGLIEGGSLAIAFFSWVSDGLNELFDDFGIKLSTNKYSLKDWGEVGRIVGGSVIVILSLMLIKFALATVMAVVMAAAQVVAFFGIYWSILLVIGAIVLLLTFFSDNKVDGAVQTISNSTAALANNISGQSGIFKAAGVDIMTGLESGMVTKMQEIGDNFRDRFTKFMATGVNGDDVVLASHNPAAKVSNAEGWTKGLFSDDYQLTANGWVDMSKHYKNRLGNVSGMSQGERSRAAADQPNRAGAANAGAAAGNLLQRQPANITIQNYIDGQKVQEKTFTMQDLYNARTD